MIVNTLCTLSKKAEGVPKGNIEPAKTLLLRLQLFILRPPPANHPIFGTHGIMHGVALKVGPRRKDFILDSRYPKRDAKVYGHNGLQVGDWWPMQLLALFNGAHGARMGGIAGNSETDAYSVVTSGGPYEDLDQDQGDILYYFGSRSHDNIDPKKLSPSSAATLALKASQRLGKPLKTNTSGGMYEQFKLERLEGQPYLSSFVKARPTASEFRDFDERENGY